PCIAGEIKVAGYGAEGGSKNEDHPYVMLLGYLAILFIYFDRIGKARMSMNAPTGTDRNAHRRVIVAKED
ncbi:MAG: hypothetical protein V3V28_06825, partial [Polaribacter sp.]|uniref:hypothetical protein n=1 Tax=Polaribacter sp. TaxID=1920175 RepID=UPI002F351791